MIATISIWSNKTIATLGMLLFSSIFLITIANTQCEATPSITIDLEEVEITPFGNTFCWIDIPYRIINPGPCDMSEFTMFFSVTTPEGTENIVHNIAGPLSPNTPLNSSIGFPSVLLKNDLDGSCYDVEDVVITTMLSTISPPMSITQVIDCPFGNGTILVCANDPSIVCNDTNCIPFVCTTDVSVNILSDDILLTEVVDDNCSITIPYEMTSNGPCDVGIFNLEIEISTSEGTETLSETISGIQAGVTTAGSIQFSSDIITDTSGDCYSMGDINIVASIPMQGDILTTTIPCPNGNGTIDVCSNNTLIVCDDTNCIPYTCDINVPLIVEINNLVINEPQAGSCELIIPYIGENLGDCNVTGFEIEIMISSPNGSQLFIVNQPGPILAGSTFSNSFTAQSTILSSPGIGCFDLADINVSIDISPADGPQVITTTITCPNGLGTIEVCVNNQDIVCDESLCELIVPLELVSLEGKEEKSSVFLNWVTAFELDNDYFLVQHSQDGIVYDSVGMIYSQGDSYNFTNYEFLHDQPYSGDNYYRLAMTDINGYTEYSKTILIELEQKKYDLTISPNPANEFINLRGLGDFSTTLKANIYTVDGQLKLTLDLNTEQLEQRIDISTLPAGLYLINIREGNYVENMKFIKL